MSDTRRRPQPEWLVRAVRRAQADAWEHDGTNGRGISTYCQTCGTLLVHGECGRCVKLAETMGEAIADELRNIRAGEGKP